MVEDLVTFQTAKLAKEKGFDEYCFKGYILATGELTKLTQIDIDALYTAFDISDEDDIFNELFFKNSQVFENYSVTAPSQAFLQKWLREKHEQHAWVEQKATYYFPRVGRFNVGDNVGKPFKEAMEIALQEALNRIS